MSQTNEFAASLLIVRQTAGQSLFKYVINTVGSCFFFVSFVALRVHF